MSEYQYYEFSAIDQPPALNARSLEHRTGRGR